MENGNQKRQGRLDKGAKLQRKNRLRVGGGSRIRERFSTELAIDVLGFFGIPVAIRMPLLILLLGLSGAGVAQLVEHLICNQRVGGSIPSASSTRNFAGE